MKGKLIVIDGTDGSGKATQVALLKERYEQEGLLVYTLDFPRYYDNFFGKFIGECLAGQHGDWADTNPYVASVAYAADRFESKKQIEHWLLEGAIVILDRFVSSNQIHQGGKIFDSKERKKFLEWLDTMEHGVFGLPRPDLIVYLHVPTEITLKLLQEKNATDKKKYLEGRGDAHESNQKHLEEAKESALSLIQSMNNWVRIECAPSGELLSREAIHEQIYQEIKKVVTYEKK